MRSIDFPNEIGSLPNEPGVYFFHGHFGGIIYIGKAKNLRNRVRSYAQKNLLEKTKQMVENASKVTYIIVQSEFEALLLEAKLIRKYKPKYNIDLRDDKTPLYIGITRDKYPKVVTYREKEKNTLNLKYSYGPFLDTKIAKEILRKTRKIFPFATHNIQKKPCIYSQIGLCNPCPSKIEKINNLEQKKILRKKYKQNISKVRYILEGKISNLYRNLEKSMVKMSEETRYEEALEIKNQISKLKLLTEKSPKVEDYILNPNLIDDIRAKEQLELLEIISNFYPTQTKLRRIECYDISHLAGSNPTASMVVFIDGEKKPQEYRHFKIKSVKNNDVLAIQEVVKRRMNHLDDWGSPDFILIDGGKPQLTNLNETSMRGIHFAGIAKREETLIFNINGSFSEIKLKEGYAKNLVVRIRNEAHRFARRLHHNLVTKTLLGEI